MHDMNYSTITGNRIVQNKPVLTLNNRLTNAYYIY